MEDYADSPALDAGLVASAQAVEHYEITRNVRQDMTLAASLSAPA